MTILAVTVVAHEAERFRYQVAFSFEGRINHRRSPLMRTKSIVIVALALLTLAVGCKRKGGGYLAPTPVPANAAP